MNINRELLVSIALGKETLTVGRLRFYSRKDRESASFEYSQEWLARPDRFPLEPALPLAEEVFHTHASQFLFGAIGDSAPGRWGRLLIQRANATGRRLYALDYLLAVNDQIRQGALRFSEITDGACLAMGEKPPPPLFKLPELLSASEKFLTNNETAAELRFLFASGASLGGTRPKASLLDKNGSLVMAKFPRQDDDMDVVRWEAVALMLAKRAGLNVPNFRLENISGKYVLIINRFDRIGDERLPFISAMTILRACDNDGHIYSYLDMADVLLKYGEEPDRDRAELWRRMVFGIMISNTDNHLRNFGFLYQWRRGWALSPVYDMNPNIEKKSFATTIDGTGAGITIELALMNASSFNIPQNRAKDILQEIKKAVSTWRQAAKSIGLPIYSIDKMKSAFLASQG